MSDDDDLSFAEEFAIGVVLQIVGSILVNLGTVFFFFFIIIFCGSFVFFF